MTIHPVVSALRHHLITVVLIAVEVALTCAVVCNLLFLVADRVSWLNVDTGLADKELVWVRVNPIKQDVDISALQAVDLQNLRAIYGVKSAVLVSSLPVTPLGRTTDVQTEPGKAAGSVEASVFVGSQGFVEAMGVKIVEGRTFRQDDYVADYAFSSAPPPAVIITKAFADALWPGKSAIGQQLYIGSGSYQSTRVVGVVEHLLRPNVASRDGRENAMMLPANRFDGAFYLLRVDPSARDRVLRNVPAALDKTDPNRLIIKNEAYSETVSTYFRGDKSLAILMLAIVLVFVSMTAFGMAGLTSFWVQQRRRQIGIRRAIGARKKDIVMYFLMENIVIVATGAIVGMFLAIMISNFLMEAFEVPRLPLPWIITGGILLVLVGQLSVLGPATRASRVSPQEATRA